MKVNNDRTQPKKFYRRVKTPTKIQMDAAECGAVSLSIISSYYGRHLKPEEAREACDVSRDGSKAINIVKAARSYGMIALGRSVDIEDLKNIKPPFIMYWEMDHFLVVDGVTDQHLYLNDPNSGQRRVDFDEANKKYSGIILEIYPGEKFEKGGDKEASVMNMLFQYLRNEKLSFLFLVFIALISILPASATAMISKVFIDYVLIGSQSSWMVGIIIALVLTGVLMCVLGFLEQYYLLRFNMRLKLVNVPQFFWRMLHLPTRFFQQRSTGDTASRLDIYDRVADAVTSEVPEAFVSCISIAFYFFLMMLIDWQLSVIVFFISILNMMMFLFLRRKMVDAGRSSAQNMGRLNGIEMNGISIIESIKSGSSEGQFFTRWAGQHAKVVNTEQKLEVYQTFLGVAPKALSYIASLLLLLLGGYFIIQGELTVGGLVALQLLFVTVKPELGKLVEVSGSFSEMKGDLIRLNDVNEFENDMDKSQGDMRTTDTDYMGPMLELKDIVFGYSKFEAPILVDFSLTLNKGERIAIVGRSGSGKSSLAKLISGLYTAWDGEVVIKGVLSQELEYKDKSQVLGYVDQMVYLFEGTVRDNISFWREDITDDAIYDVLEIVGLADFVNARGGLDFLVDEGGENLSGGQAQRVEIARALVKQPEVLILDEATSALDEINEKKIYESIMKLGISLVIIAHRLSAVKQCEKIIVFNDGEIIEEGTHNELIKQQGFYHNLMSLE